MSKKAKVSKYGQWQYPGEHTIIPDANGSITMKGVPYPVFGIDDLGNQQMMMPGGEYQFPGNSVYEIPMMAYGGDISVPDLRRVTINALPKAQIEGEFSNPDFKPSWDWTQTAAENAELNRRAQLAGHNSVDDYRASGWAWQPKQYQTPSVQDQVFTGRYSVAKEDAPLPTMTKSKIPGLSTSTNPDARMLKKEAADVAEWVDTEYKEESPEEREQRSKESFIKHMTTPGKEDLEKVNEETGYANPAYTSYLGDGPELGGMSLWNPEAIAGSGITDEDVNDYLNKVYTKQQEDEKVGQTTIDLAFSKDLDKEAIQNLKNQLEKQKGTAFWANAAVDDSEFLKKFDYYQEGRRETIRKNNMIGTATSTFGPLDAAVSLPALSATLAMPILGTSLTVGSALNPFFYAAGINGFLNPNSDFSQAAEAWSKGTGSGTDVLWEAALNSLNFLGAKSLPTDIKNFGKAYTEVATGNSIIPYAWRSPAVGLSQEASAEMFNSLLNSGKLTPEENALIIEYQSNSRPFTGRSTSGANILNAEKRTALNNIINKYQLQFPQNSNAIATRRFNFERGNLGADIENGRMNFGDRPTSFSVGVGTEGYSGAPDRLVIPSRHVKNMGNNFLVNPYGKVSDETLGFLEGSAKDFALNAPSLNEAIINERELIGTGLNFKQIGKVKNDIGGFDVIVKPRTTAEAFKAASTRSAAGESGGVTLDKWPTLFGKKSAGPVNTPLGPQAELDLANARAKAFSESAFNKLKLQRFRPGETFNVSNQEARFMDDPELAKMYNDYHAMDPKNPSTFNEWFIEGHGQHGPSGRYTTNAFGDTNDILAINKVNDVGAPAKNILLDAGHEATHSRSLRLKSTQAERDIAMDAWQPMVDVNMANNNQWSIGPANGFNQAAEEAFAVQNELRTFLNDFDGSRVYTDADIPEIQSAVQKLASTNHPYLTQDAANLIDIKKLIKSLNVIGLGVTAPLLINATKEQKKRGGRIKNVDFIASRNNRIANSLPKAQTMGEVPYEIAEEPYRDPKISRDSYDREYYDPMTETIHMKPSYPNVIHEAMVKDHESEHHNQKLKGRMSSTEYWPGPLKEPVIGASADMIYPYYNRATQDVYNLMGAAPQSTLFGIPEDVAVMGFQDKTYDTPGTAEYEAEHVSREPRTLYMGDPVVENAIDKTLGRQRQDPEMMFKDKYNTELTKEEQKDFDKWVAKESKQQGRDIMMDKGAYDIQGFWKSGDWKNRDADNHGTDTWKKPNHPTFSNQSKYNGEGGWYGGNWTEDAGYQPSKQTFNNYGPDYYNWMFGDEPNRPEHLDMSRYISGENYGFPITYEQGGNVRRVKIKSLPKNWKNQ